ncbi:GNAT family N-acetyltransferase [Microbacterium kyungheense]|uniref:RimJ/RimL family protein N-acetyltransferase n=1 Tax=Microbacterium kyungheense TaxID=1263636 RepID=A0A543F0Q0_9MICO|nr:GNAT family N-acetyltransferase [Microbacterium kyungheense]TQM27403.1 RimJ/RimL family protein N-acetyltransferase [Microbacterium kyungheense]
MLAALDLPATLTTRDGDVTLRAARPDDLDALMALLSDDPISAARGDNGLDEIRPAYARALARIADDPANTQLVVTDGDRLIGTMQLTVIPGLARAGSDRLQVETVRVASDRRSSGIGAAMMHWVEEVAAPDLGTSLIQLTSDAARVDAHRFYERLGFTPSHVGFKLRVPRA